ncbi:MAG: hypothetical protein KAU20_02655, partial [Nanoarchaeota archaeon]|nr:hypothetical protein [Nanoarchaeota archaeon]
HHSPTDAEIATPAEVTKLRQSYLNKADTYANRCVEFLCKNTTQYPEYSQSVADGLVAQKQALYTGGLLVEQASCNTVERVGSADANLFIAETFWGNSNEPDPIVLDYANLSEQNNILPYDVWATPNDTYFWMVSSIPFKIAQLQTDIPLDLFSNETEEEAVYVYGEYGGNYYLRIKVLGYYTQPVQFQIIGT